MPDNAPEQQRPGAVRLSAGEVNRRRGVWFFVLGMVGGLLGAFIYVHDFASSIPVDKRQLVVQESSAVIDVAKKVSPAVVSITTQTVQPGLFGFGSTQAEAAGTGMIITSDGLILTNNHVISGSTSVTVFTSDGKQYKGSVVAANSAGDYAFVQISAKNLPTVSLGDSGSVQIGQKVVAIGNALGQFQNTVTEGIISGKGRPVQAADSGSSTVESLSDLFQTDAAINEGNSGGPLVNLDGQVIGINTAIAGNAQSIGFAIPINEIKNAINSVKSKGTIEQPYLGVRYIPITADFASANNLPVSNGAYVHGNGSQLAVVPDSPADKAGVKDGDIITKIDGQKLDENHSLTSIISQHKVGDTVTLTILRDGKTITLKAKLAQAPTNLQ
jgi:serine protease Do